MLIVVFHKTIAPKLFPINSCSHVVLIGNPVERKQEVGDKWHEKHGNKFMIRIIKSFLLQCSSTSVICITISTVKSLAYERNIV